MNLLVQVAGWENMSSDPDNDNLIWEWHCGMRYPLKMMALTTLLSRAPVHFNANGHRIEGARSRSSIPFTIRSDVGGIYLLHFDNLYQNAVNINTEIQMRWMGRLVNASDMRVRDYLKAMKNMYVIANLRHNKPRAVATESGDVLMSSTDIRQIWDNILNNRPRRSSAFSVPVEDPMTYNTSYTFSVT